MSLTMKSLIKIVRNIIDLLPNVSQKWQFEQKTVHILRRNYTQAVAKYRTKKSMKKLKHSIYIHKISLVRCDYTWKYKYIHIQQFQPILPYSEFYRNSKNA
jgi:hypothetical protein